MRFIILIISVLISFDSLAQNKVGINVTPEETLDVDGKIRSRDLAGSDSSLVFVDTLGNLRRASNKRTIHLSPTLFSPSREIEEYLAVEFYVRLESDLGINVPINLDVGSKINSITMRYIVSPGSSSWIQFFLKETPIGSLSSSQLFNYIGIQGTGTQEIVHTFSTPHEVLDKHLTMRITKTGAQSVRYLGLSIEYEVGAY